MMLRMLTAAAVMIAASAAAEADCKSEVAGALERQRKTSAFRMDTVMLTEQGRVKMTVDYVLPDRMRQVIHSAGDAAPVETVLVGKSAWTRQGGDWAPVHPQIRDALVNQVAETFSAQPGALGDFECLGKKKVDGRDLLAYQGENVEPGPKNMTPGAKDKPKLPDRPVRIIYVDPITGLPMRSVFARANKLELPIFEATYSYPVDIRIEPPQAAAVQ